MKGIGKRLIAVLAALALAFSVFPLGSPAVEVKADAPQKTIRTSEGSIWEAEVWYAVAEDVLGDQVSNYASSTVNERFRAIAEKCAQTNKYGVTDANNFNPDGDTEDGHVFWEKINAFVFDEVTVDNTYENDNCTTRSFVVASSGAITLGTNDAHSDAGTTKIRVTESATIDGLITLTGLEGKEGILEIGSGAAVRIRENGGISTPESGKGYVFVEEGASVINADGSYVQISVNNTSVTFNNSQDGNYYLFCVDGAWSGKSAPSIMSTIELPRDEASMIYTLDNNGWDYKFKEVVVAETCSWNRSWIDTEKFVINESATFTINQGEGDENGTLVPRAEGVHADEAVISGSLVINGTEEIEESNRFDVYNSLVVNEGGSITVNDNSIFYIGEDARFTTGGNPVVATFDAEIFGPLTTPITITLDGSQERGYSLIPGENGGWIVKEDGSEVKYEIILPEEEDSFNHTRGMYDWIHRDAYKEQDYPPVCFNSITVKNPGFETDCWISVKNLTVEQGAELTLKWWADDKSSDTGDSSIRLDETATISGTLTIKGDGRDKTGTFEIVKDAILTIPQGGSLVTEGTGRIQADAGSIIHLGSTPLTVKIGSENVTFDGNQTIDAVLWCKNGTWTGKLGPHVVTKVILPEEEEDLWFTADYYWDQGKDPYFESIEITDNYSYDHGWFYTEKLIVDEGKTLTLKQGEEYEQHAKRNGIDLPVYDPWGGIAKRKDSSGMIALDAEIAGTVKVEECDTPWFEWEWKENSEEENGGHFEVVMAGDESNCFEARNLTITDTGYVDANADGASIRFGVFDEWDVRFGDKWVADRYYVSVPSTQSINSKNPFRIEANTTIKVGGTVYTLPVVYSGNPGDETTTHANFKFDETRINDNGAWFVSQTDGSWALKEADEDGNLQNYDVWWGAPFNNEYRVYFKKGSVKIGGSEYATGTFHSYTVNTPFEVELVPPADFTGTPIVFINGGYYNIGEDYMRSDDFKTSDLWWENPATVTKLEVKDNKFTYTPKDDKGIEIYVYYDPEDIMYDAMYFLDRKYDYSGKFEDDGKYCYYPSFEYNPEAGQKDEEGNVIEGYTKFGVEEAWADPGNEFMVEVTQINTNGVVEMTHGIDFYRTGNKVKALYQGFELLNGGVEIKFTPASGYDLTNINVDGQNYSPLAYTGMKYSGGVYTLTIDSLPTQKDATLKGLYPKYRNNDFVRIKKITATFGIKYTPSYDDGGSTSGGTSGGTEGGTEGGTTSGGSTDAVTPGTDDGTTSGGSGASEEAEPEVKKQTTTTDKADDGTQTTTTSTTYTDGSKVTEKVVEKPDGSSTATTTTTEADGTKIVEKVEEKADGSSKATTTTTETDGTKKTETVEKKVDGTEVTTNTVKDTDGSTTTEKVERKTDGTITTTNTVKDADGASTTEKVVEKPDGSVTTTSTEKDADGNVLSTSKVVEKTKEDGTKTITATEKNADGSSSTSKTTINTDGSSKTNTTTQNADGSTTKEKITEKADGSLTRTATTTDEDGNVLATEKEKVTISKSGTETSTTTVENADGSSSESVVKTKADGTATSTLTETDASGNVSVTIGSTKKDGSGISKSYAVEDDGVVLTAVEATTTSASIPASVKVNGKTVPVTSVGENAMKDNETVKTVKLADSITSIGEGAFSGASNLKTIKLSANITEIAPGAFDGIKKNATFYISAATDEEFDALVELLKKSGVGSKVKFKRA